MKLNELMTALRKADQDVRVEFQGAKGEMHTITEIEVSDIHTDCTVLYPEPEPKKLPTLSETKVILKGMPTP